MCDEDTVDGDAEDVITIVKRIDQRLREASKPPMIDPDIYDDEPTEGAVEPGPEEPPLEVAKRLLQQAESAVHDPQRAHEYRQQAEVWLMVHQEGRF